MKIRKKKKKNNNNNNKSIKHHGVHARRFASQTQKLSTQSQENMLLTLKQESKEFENKYKKMKNFLNKTNKKNKSKSQKQEWVDEYTKLEKAYSKTVSSLISIGLDEELKQFLYNWHYKEEEIEEVSNPVEMEECLKEYEKMCFEYEDDLKQSYPLTKIRNSKKGIVYSNNNSMDEFLKKIKKKIPGDIRDEIHDFISCMKILGLFLQKFETIWKEASEEEEKFQILKKEYKDGIGKLNITRSWEIHFKKLYKQYLTIKPNYRKFKKIICEELKYSGMNKEKILLFYEMYEDFKKKKNKKKNNDVKCKRIVKSLIVDMNKSIIISVNIEKMKKMKQKMQKEFEEKKNKNKKLYMTLKNQNLIKLKEKEEKEKELKKLELEQEKKLKKQIEREREKMKDQIMEYKEKLMEKEKQKEEERKILEFEEEKKKKKEEKKNKKRVKYRDNLEKKKLKRIESKKKTILNEKKLKEIRLEKMRKKVRDELNVKKDKKRMMGETVSFATKKDSEKVGLPELFPVTSFTNDKIFKNEKALLIEALSHAGLLHKPVVREMFKTKMVNNIY